MGITLMKPPRDFVFPSGVCCSVELSHLWHDMQSVNLRLIRLLAMILLPKEQVIDESVPMLVPTVTIKTVGETTHCLIAVVVFPRHEDHPKGNMQQLVNTY